MASLSCVTRRARLGSRWLRSIGSFRKKSHHKCGSSEILATPPPPHHTRHRHAEVPLHLFKLDGYKIISEPRTRTLKEEWKMTQRSCSTLHDTRFPVSPYLPQRAPTPDSAPQRSSAAEQNRCSSDQELSRSGTPVGRFPILGAPPLTNSTCCFWRRSFTRQVGSPRTSPCQVLLLFIPP